MCSPVRLVFPLTAVSNQLFSLSLDTCKYWLLAALLDALLSAYALLLAGCRTAPIPRRNLVDADMLHHCTSKYEGMSVSSTLRGQHGVTRILSEHDWSSWCAFLWRSSEIECYSSS